MGPRLSDGDLALAPFADQHLHARYVGWLNDPAVVRFSEQRHRRHTAESCRQYRDGMAAGGHCFWAMEWQGEHIGNLTAYCDRRNGVADLAILIGETRLQGQSLGRRSWALALDWLLTDGGFRKVTAGTMACNLPMLRVFERTGMREEGRRLRQFLLDGEEIDLVQVARFASVEPGMGSGDGGKG